ncbi:MAG TPA: hypothetical protein VNQ73_11065 [Ilumatobacter sp.]|nr:hypothetical protein [Ilumatobacter sp.]
MTVDIPPPAPDAGGPAADQSVAPLRQCGRCRLYFPVPPGTDPSEVGDWWVCPNCAQALLPIRERAAQAT